jgi:hypothetical protein
MEEREAMEPLHQLQEHLFFTLPVVAGDLMQATRVLVEVVLEEPVETNPRLQPQDL